MTVRDYLLRRARFGKVLTYAGMGLVLVAFFVLEPARTRSVIPYALGLMIIGALVTHLAVRCPKCRGNLAFAPIGRFRIFGKQSNFCPYCGVSMEDPCPKRQ
jgi:hypothetical protein